jgi:hypothetical protein
MSGSGQSTGPSGRGINRSASMAPPPRADHTMPWIKSPRIRRRRNLQRIEREFRQRNALLHCHHTLLVDDFEATLSLDVPEV